MKRYETTWKDDTPRRKEQKKDPQLTSDAHLNEVSASAAAPPQAPCKPYPVQEPYAYYIM